MTKIILVRHGQTLWNQQRKYQGHSDVPLSEIGLRQAQLARERLAQETIDAAYASDLSRAMLTAQTIVAERELTVRSEPDLREIKFGSWEGLSYEQIMAKWPKAMEKFWHKPAEAEIPGGETFAQVQTRSYAAVERIVAAHPAQTVLIASHGAAICSILSAALHMPLNYVWNIRQNNTAINIIEYYDDSVVVSLMNDSLHLENMQNSEEIK